MELLRLHYAHGSWHLNQRVSNHGGWQSHENVFPREEFTQG